jgi:hypothetical protein
MKTYFITSVIGITVHTQVTAKSAKEAKSIALRRGVMGLCHQCADGDSKTEEWVTSGELDGTPEKILDIQECDGEDE